jgi:hypothetical protein
VPSLDLNFAGTKTLDPRVSFTRASSGMFVDSSGAWRLAAANEPRFDHNPTTGESLGLLVEEARTNLLYPSQFTSFGTSANNNVWYETFADVDATPNAGIAPDGTTTAALVSCTATTSFRAVTNRTNQSTAGTYAYSVFCKANLTDVNVRLLVGGESTLTNTVRADFALTGNGTASAATVVGTAVSAATPSIQPMGNGWYRCVIAATFILPTNITCLIYPGSGSAQTTASQTLVWGAQLEAGAFPTSYIPTTGATATRAADVVQITGAAFSSFYNQAEGTVFADVTLTRPPSLAGSNIIGIGDGTNSNRVQIGASTTSSGNINGVVTTGGVAQAQPLVSSISSVGPHKIAFGYATNSVQIGVNGSLGTEDTSATMPSAITSLNFANGANPNAPASITFGRLTYWPTRLANATLQAITQP